jgi:hypothetical protein
MLYDNIVLVKTGDKMKFYVNVQVTTEVTRTIPLLIINFNVTKKNEYLYSAWTDGLNLKTKTGLMKLLEDAKSFVKKSFFKNRPNEAIADVQPVLIHELEDDEGTSGPPSTPSITWSDRFSSIN